MTQESPSQGSQNEDTNTDFPQYPLDLTSLHHNQPSLLPPGQRVKCTSLLCLW